MPGKSHAGPLPPLSDEERALAERLRRHVFTLAKSERNTDLETPVRYIEGAFAAHGLTSKLQTFESGGRNVNNVEVSPPDPAAIVVGAHYDTVPGSPGADDNASAVAALIELAGLLRKERLPIRFVAFANEELPYHMGPEMGSWVSARRSREQAEPLRGMISLEMLGCYRDEPGSQRYPPPLNLIYPNRGNFIAFVGDVGARALVHQAIASFRRNARFPSEGVAAPAFVPRIHGHRHRVQPKSALPQGQRHGRHARLRAHGARHPCTGGSPARPGCRESLISPTVGSIYSQRTQGSYLTD